MDIPLINMIYMSRLQDYDGNCIAGDGLSGG